MLVCVSISMNEVMSGTPLLSLILLPTKRSKKGCCLDCPPVLCPLRVGSGMLA